jgi:hypothetical protein
MGNELRSNAYGTLYPLPQGDRYTGRRVVPSCVDLPPTLLGHIRHRKRNCDRVPISDRAG